MFNLFPYLKGWEYKFHRLNRNNIVRGDPPIQKRVSETGWLLSVSNLTTDCYGTVTVAWQGANLETQSLSGYPASGIVLGAFSQDPAGWVQRYFRPNPNSSAGIFVDVLFSGGLQGAAWPYVPTVVISIELPLESNQSTAYIGATATTIAITNKNLWLKSLRSLLGVKGKIDPALLQLGMDQMVEDIQT